MISFNVSIETGSFTDLCIIPEEQRRWHMTREEIRRKLLEEAFFIEDGSWSGRISRYRGNAREKQGWPWLLENLRALSAEEYKRREHEVACHIMQIAVS